MSLSLQEVQHVARLARMRLSDEEQTLMQEQLSAILEYIEVLQEVDVTGVEPMAHVTGITTYMRDDEAVAPLSQDDVLSNAPDQRDGLFRVRAIFE